MRNLEVPGEIWWCKTHEVGQAYDEGPWWDEWSPYVCAFKAEYPVDGDCDPVRVELALYEEGSDDGGVIELSGVARGKNRVNPTP